MRDTMYLAARWCPAAVQMGFGYWRRSAPDRLEMRMAGPDWRRHHSDQAGP